MNLEPTRMGLLVKNTNNGSSGAFKIKLRCWKSNWSAVRNPKQNNASYIHNILKNN
ncbi:hypothetical protein [Subsaximicrobium wynnwilliamsii]|uniref:hypothetical protein n=1 Tax=Subsaximicrobium wynnwilliamsii TaxID=291179 RepID=UPI0016770CC6|nr:hypothetical protein [Subsaximicrobium wynnwilliamsii]